jgi:hypothetical protein
LFVCIRGVECLIGKQKKPILFKVTEPSSIPYRTHPVTSTKQALTLFNLRPITGFITFVCFVLAFPSLYLPSRPTSPRALAADMCPSSAKLLWPPPPPPPPPPLPLTWASRRDSDSRTIRLCNRDPPPPPGHTHTRWLHRAQRRKQILSRARVRNGVLAAQCLV